jgi:hypothetical protein
MDESEWEEPERLNTSRSCLRLSYCINAFFLCSLLMPLVGFMCFT